MRKEKGHEMNDNIFLKGCKMLKRQGPVKTFKKAVNYLKFRRKINYMLWCRDNEPSQKELLEQRHIEFNYEPLISVVVPMYRTEEKYLIELIDSLKRQTYSNWELCLADGSCLSSEENKVSDMIKERYKGDLRIRYNALEKNLGISGNTNKAIEMAKGEWIVFADHDDVIAPNAFFECVERLNEEDGKNILMIYTDEDKISEDSSKRFYPHFKPDFSLDLLRSQNYICHMLMVSADFQKKVGKMREEYDGAQDYDFILRCVEKISKLYGLCECSKHIAHIPSALYHWRAHEGSTAGSMDSKNYAHEAGKRELIDHYSRMGIDAEVFSGEDGMFYRTRYKIKTDADGNKPKVSIIIPNKDHFEDLEKCINSIFKQDYDNYEIVIVENHSETKNIKRYYEKIETDERVKILTWNRKFNFSAICNFAVDKTNSEYILFLNNDTEMINNDCISELVSFCQRDEVGVVGARMYFPNGRLQHAGVILGFNGIAGHLFAAMKEDDGIYFHRSSMAQNFCAVTGACLMIKRTVFEEVGRFNELMEIAVNDVDLCVRVFKSGKLVTYNPNAKLYHYESKTRGVDIDAVALKRLDAEKGLFLINNYELVNNDPYYNPNLTFLKPDCSLR